MSITIELPRRRFAIGDATRTLRSRLGSLVARNTEFLIQYAFATVGLIVTFALTLHEIAKLQFRLASRFDPYCQRSKPRAGVSI
jgi:hypothetical protein